MQRVPRVPGWRSCGPQSLAILRPSVARQGRLLPTPAQCFVYSDQAGRGRGPALRQGVFSLELCTLGMEHLEETHVSTLVAGSSEPARCGASRSSISHMREAV